MKIKIPNIFLQQNRFIEIPDYGEIGAGTVVPFPSEETKKNQKKIKIPVTSNMVDGDILFSHTVNGDSLNDFNNSDRNIRNGDILICKENITIRDVKPDKICVVFIHQTCEKLAKHVILPEGSDDVILRSPNPHYQDRKFPRDLVEIKGIVIGFKRMF